MVVNRGCSHDWYCLEETAVSLVSNYTVYDEKADFLDCIRLFRINDSHSSKIRSNHKSYVRVINHNKLLYRGKTRASSRDCSRMTKKNCSNHCLLFLYFNAKKYSGNTKHSKIRKDYTRLCALGNAVLTTVVSLFSVSFSRQWLLVLCVVLQSNSLCTSELLFL